MLRFSDLVFFSINYLGVRNRKVFIINIVSVLISMMIIVLTLSFYEYLKFYENKSIEKTGLANIISIEIRNIDPEINTYQFWKKFSEHTKQLLIDHELNFIQHIYPVHHFQAFLKAKRNGKLDELPVLIKNIETKCNEFKELSIDRYIDKSFQHKPENFDYISGLIIDKDIIYLTDNAKSIQNIDFLIQLNKQTRELSNFPIIAIATNIRQQYVYINSKELWKIINSERSNNNFVKPPYIEVILDNTDKEKITSISRFLKDNKNKIFEIIQPIDNYNLSIEKHYTNTNASVLSSEEPIIIIKDIFDINHELINTMEDMRKASLIIGIIASGLIFILIIINIMRTIEEKKKEIGYLLAAFATKDEISLMFLGNMFFISMLSLIITISYTFITFLIKSKGFLFFHPPSWPCVIIGLIGVVVFSMAISFIFVYKISKIDPIKIIQNVSD